MKQTKRFRTLLIGTTLAAAACLSLQNSAHADSEAGFIMVGGGESESGGWGSAGESESTGIHWGANSESGGPFDTGAESDSGGALQSEASSQSGGALNSGSSSEASVGGTERSWGKYVQYYGR